MASELPKFLVTRGFVYECVHICELPAGVWAEGRWKHTWWFWVTSCLRHTVSLSVSVSSAGNAAHHGYWITFVYSCCFYLYRWFTLTYRQGCTSNGITKTSTIQKRNAPKHQRNDFLSSPFPSFVFGDSRTLHLCLHTHKHTHINSPLGVCCFHYLQLGPETAFRVEYSEAELAGIAVYIERSLVIASSLFSLSCASGGKYECVASGDHPAALHLATTVCPPHRAQVIAGKQRA